MSPAERRDYTEHLITEKEVMDQIKLKYKAAQTKFQALLKLHGKKAIEFLAQFLHPEAHPSLCTSNPSCMRVQPFARPTLRTSNPP
tara:strand:+ start:78 stop:335 length:258 start_codon:yes stop_codon:yes gene_type:complete